MLLGTGALLIGACPSLRSSGTGTAADVGASPLGSRLAFLASPPRLARPQIFPAVCQASACPFQETLANYAFAPNSPPL